MLQRRAGGSRVSRRPADCRERDGSSGGHHQDSPQEVGQHPVALSEDLGKLTANAYCSDDYISQSLPLTVVRLAAKES